MAYQFNTWIQAALGAGAALAGSLLNNSAQADTNRANADLARENRDWQERMAKNAHTYEVADLKNAGINPILTATGGGGAATPSGGVIPMEAPKTDLQAVVNSARAGMELEKLDCEVQLQKDQSALLKEQKKNVKETTVKTKKEGNFVDIESEMYLPNMIINAAKLIPGIGGLFGGGKKKGKKS